MTAADEDDAAVEACVRAFQDMVSATATRLLGDPVRPKIARYQRFATVGGSPAAGGWLKKVTINSASITSRGTRRRWQLSRSCSFTSTA